MYPGHPMSALSKSSQRTLTAPISVVDVVSPDGVWYPSWGVNPLNAVRDDEPADRCYLCGQRISWRVVVKDGHGASHVIGQDCAARVSKSTAALVSHAHNRAVARLEAARAREAAAEPLSLFAASSRAALQGKPHPMQGKQPWAKKLTMLDYAKWWIDNVNAKPENLRHALATCQEALGVESARERAMREAKEAKEGERTQAMEAATAKARTFLSLLAKHPDLKSDLQGDIALIFAEITNLHKAGAGDPEQVRTLLAACRKAVM